MPVQCASVLFFWGGGRVKLVIHLIFLFVCNTAAYGDDNKDNENENVTIPLLMRNALPDVDGFEKNEKLDIAMRPEQVSLEV